MFDLLLVTFTARYSHSAFGLRCLNANMGELSSRCRILEYDIRKHPIEAAEEILAFDPKIVCFSVHIWNVTLVRSTAKILRTVSPGLRLIAGGPELSHDCSSEPLNNVLDVIIQGEGELLLPKICFEMLQGTWSGPSIMKEQKPELQLMELPYNLYDREDIDNRVIYVESSRGCPFKCAYCMSSLDSKLRYYPLEDLFESFESLLSRGARHFKFVDRTFNASSKRAVEILRFFSRNYVEGLLIHLELVPSNLSRSLKRELAAFPEAALHLEIGVQTFNEEVGKRVQRPFKASDVENSLAFLIGQTGAMVHADLILALPGEDFQSFAEGFNRLLFLGPQELQVNLLKCLPGSPLKEKAQSWGLQFSEDPPYRVLASDKMSFSQIQDLERFGRFFELIHNRGKLDEVSHLLTDTNEPFQRFFDLAQGLYSYFGRSHHISLEKLARQVHDFMVFELGFDRETAQRQ